MSDLLVGAAGQNIADFTQIVNAPILMTYMGKFTRALVLIGLILAVHGWAILSGWYEFHKWFDIPMHFLGGVAIGLLALAIWDTCIDHIVFNKQVKPFLQLLVYVVGIVGVVAIVGVLWEVYEFIFDTWASAASLDFRPAQMGLGDTMADLCLDLFGGLTAFVLGRRRF